MTRSWMLRLTAFAVALTACIAISRVRLVWRQAHGLPVEAAANVSPEVMLALAISPSLPQYPASSVRAGAAGVSVAQVLTTATGTADRVVVLEAPDASISAAVRQALLGWRWKVKVPDTAVARPLSGKVVLYFRTESGSGIVMTSKDALARMNAPPRVGS
jgi:hypothetical protein